MIRSQTPKNSRQNLRADFIGCWKARPQVSLSQWVAENVRLSEDLEASGGRYDLRYNPFYAEILDAMLDPMVRVITLMKSTQVGGTVTGIAAMMGIAEIDPAPGLSMHPDQNEATLMRDRVYANAGASRATRHMDIPERNRNIRAINLRSMLWHLAWAGGTQRLRGKPCKRVFRHEVDVYPRGGVMGGDVIKASGNRVMRFAESLIYNESTPSDDPSTIDDMHKQGDQRVWMCPCSKCGHYQELRFFPHREGPYAGCGGVVGYKDEHGGLLPVDLARRKAAYVCEKGCVLTNTAIKRMVLRGRWVPKGCSVTKGKIRGKPEKSGRNRSYQLWRIHSPTKTLGDLVEEYINAKVENKLREFWENTLGRKYRSARFVPEWKALGLRLERGYSRGTVPAEAYFLIGTADVQVDGCWWLVRAWGDGARSWLIDYGFVQRYRGSEAEGRIRSDLAQLRLVMIDRYFPIAGEGKNPFGRKSVKPRLIGLDSNHRPRDVHSFIVDQYGRRSRQVRAIRGEHMAKPTDERWKESEILRPRRGGREYPGGPRPIWNLYTTVYKEAQLEKYVLAADEPGSLYMPSGIATYGVDYLKQITNELPGDELDKRTGRLKTVWKVQRENVGNHLWDNEIYNAVLADILLAELGFSWDSRDWKKKTPVDRKRVSEIDVSARENMST